MSVCGRVQLNDLYILSISRKAAKELEESPRGAMLITKADLAKAGLGHLGDQQPFTDRKPNEGVFFVVVLLECV